MREVMREGTRIHTREVTRNEWRVSKRDRLRAIPCEVTRRTTRDALRVKPQDDVRSVQRFDTRVCLREVSRDFSQDEERARGRAVVRGAASGSCTELRADRPPVSQAESVGD